MSVYLDAADFAHFIALQQREIAQLDERIAGYGSQGVPAAYVDRLRDERDQCVERVKRTERYVRSLATAGRVSK